MEMRDDGLIDPEVFDGFEKFLLNAFTSEGSRWWWDNMQFPNYVAPRVRERMNRLFAEYDRDQARGRR